MIKIVLLLILLATSAFSGTRQTIVTLPGENTSFPSDAIEFMADEDARRYDRQFRGFVYTGGLGPVSVNLSHTIEATIAFVDGYSSAQDNTVHTYTASRDTFVYYDSIDDRGGITVNGGSGCTYDENNGRFIFVECATGSAIPVVNVPGLLLLSRVVTDADNITTVNDHRPTNSEKANVVNLKDALVGARCDGITDDTVAINKAMALAVTEHKIVMIPGASTCLFTSEIIVPHEVSVIGHGRVSSILKPVGAIRGLVYDGQVNFEQSALFAHFSLYGDYTQALDLLTITGEIWGVKVDDVRLRGTTQNALMLNGVVGFSITRSEISEFALSGIATASFANRISVRNNRFEDWNVANTVAAINLTGGANWDIIGNSFESGLLTSRAALSLNGSYNISFEWNYAERYNHHIVVAHTAPSSTISIRGNVLHTFAPHKLDFVTGGLAHSEIVVTLNNFDGVSEISKIMLVSVATTSFTFRDNHRGSLVEPLEYVEGYPGFVKTVIEEPQPVMVNGIALGDWNRSLQLLPATNILQLANAVNMSNINLHIGGTDALVLEEIVATFAGVVTPGSVAFSGLPVRNNGSVVYCTDCTKATPCAGAGAGALAKRINGLWDCD